MKEADPEEISSSLAARDTAAEVLLVKIQESEVIPKLTPWGALKKKCTVVTDKVAAAVGDTAKVVDMVTTETAEKEVVAAATGTVTKAAAEAMAVAVHQEEAVLEVATVASPQAHELLNLLKVPSILCNQTISALPQSKHRDRFSSIKLIMVLLIAESIDSKPLKM